MKRKLIMFIIIASLIFIVLVLVLVLSFSRRDISLFLKSENSFSYNDQNRKYLVSTLPAKIDAESKLIIALHGYTDNPKRFAYYSAFHNSVKDSDVVVYPRAIAPAEKNLRPGWNSGFCCGSGWVQQADDSGFLAELTKQLIGEYGISKENVYILGYSNGAFMAQRVVVDNPGLFNGMVVASGAIGTTKKRLYPSQPINTLLMHGAKDTVVQYEGGVSPTDPDIDWLPFSETKKAWETVNNQKARMEVKIYENNKHRWNDWRLANFWNKTTEEAERSYNFLDSL